MGRDPESGCRTAAKLFLLVPAALTWLQWRRRLQGFDDGCAASRTRNENGGVNARLRFVIGGHPFFDFRNGVAFQQRHRAAAETAAGHATAKDTALDADGPGNFNQASNSLQLTS